MLVLTREVGESVVVHVGGEVTKVTIRETRGQVVRLDIEAARSVIDDREEVYGRKRPCARWPQEFVAFVESLGLRAELRGSTAGLVLLIDGEPVATFSGAEDAGSPPAPRPGAHLSKAAGLASSARAEEGALASPATPFNGGTAA